MEQEEKRRFLIYAAELLHRHGTPSHRLERVMMRVASTLNVTATFLYTPTALFISTGEGAAERTRLLRVDAGDVELGKLVEFDEILENLDDGKIRLHEAQRMLEQAEVRPPRFSLIPVSFASAVASGSAAVFFGGGLAEVLVAISLGWIICILGGLVRRWTSEANLYEPLAGFVSAFLSIIVSRWIWPIDDRLATLASLIILIPGLSFTIAMSELAARHLSAGVARMAGAGSTFLILAVGVALAWRLGDPMRPLVNPDIEPLPLWATYVALVIAPFAFSILFQARKREWPIICIVSIIGFLSAQVSNYRIGPEFGPFAGALAVSIGSNLYARWFDRPALVPLIPGILILVPGSLGYLSLTSFIDERALEGVEFAFATAIVAVSLVGGSIVANALVPPKRIL